jgi:hypothetical protein
MSAFLLASLFSVLSAQESPAAVPADPTVQSAPSGKAHDGGGLSVVKQSVRTSLPLVAMAVTGSASGIMTTGFMLGTAGLVFLIGLMSTSRPLELSIHGPEVNGNLAFPAALFLAGGPVVLVGSLVGVAALASIGLSIAVLLLP